MTVFFCVHFPPNKTHSQHFLSTKSGLKVGVSIMCVELHHVMPPAMAVSFSLIVSQGLYDELLGCC